MEIKIQSYEEFADKHKKYDGNNKCFVYGCSKPAYCALNDNPINNEIRQLIQDRGSVSILPFITNITRDGEIITDGRIGEVSLVLARIDPDEAYYPVAI